MRRSTPFVANDVNYVNVYCNIHGWKFNLGSVGSFG